MLTRTSRQRLIFSFLVVLSVALTHAHGQESAKMGEVRFTADNQAERDSGVWIDGKYAGCQRAQGRPESDAFLGGA